MGYYANSTGYLTIQEENVEAFKAVCREHLDWASDQMSLPEMIGLCVNEHVDGHTEVISPGLIDISWMGAGKQLWDDEDVYTAIAPLVQGGTIDWIEDLDSDTRWRIRFENKSWTLYPGVVTTTYPGDPYDKLEDRS